MKMFARLMAGVAVAAMTMPARAGDGETTLAAEVDSLDGVPDALHGFYTERDGKFKLNVTGLPDQGSVTRLTESLRKEREDHGKTKTKLNLVTNNGARTPEEVVADLERIPELEASQGTIDQEKIDRIVESRLAAKLGPVERERDNLKTQVAEKDQTIAGHEAKDRTRTIHDKVREDAVKAKLLPEAVEDALMLADRVMELDEAGNVVTKDNVGVTPGISPSVWFTDLQKTRSHWWGPSEGGGAGGQRGNTGDTTSNPFTHENWNLTKQGELVQQDRTKADQMAKAAGTTVGGARPPAKK